MDRQTVIWQVPQGVYDDGEALAVTPEILEAANVLREGGLVAFPTETVYGLGANGLDASAVDSIFIAKGRPSDNPLILHIADLADLDQIVARLPARAACLAEVFWPGPLTLVLPKTKIVPMTTTGGLDTVAVRMPAHPVALALIRATGVPLAAPSANVSGRPSPTRAEHVANDLMGKIDVILDGGPTGIGVESTVVDCTGLTPIILRPGGVSKEDLEQAVGGPVELISHQAAEDLLDGPAPSPGMKYRHYAPKAPALLVTGEPPRLFDQLATMARDLVAKGEQVGLMVSREAVEYWQEQSIDTTSWQIICMGSRGDLKEIAANIYGGLRDLDNTTVTRILLESVPKSGLGLAIMNRLAKAAGSRIVGQ
ncbi:MAG: threonylcarbamoyl-AMP synthase [Firmicutes bacterium]|nr:threonylcarbamoyl-AMP synthase [Bacillota bacterium]